MSAVGILNTEIGFKTQDEVDAWLDAAVEEMKNRTGFWADRELVEAEDAIQE